VNTVRLNVGDRSEERRNRFLYDLENKYKNVKSQLSEEYVVTLLKGADPASAPLQRSIKELFRTFFPGKEFLGVTLNTKDVLTFPVRLSTGETHDIDELYSGEKEIVCGYLWLRTGTPLRSVVLIDEPELHLNPAQRALPQRARRRGQARGRAEGPASADRSHVARRGPAVHQAPPEALARLEVAAPSWGRPTRTVLGPSQSFSFALRRSTVETPNAER